MTDDTAISPSANGASRSARRRTSLLRFPDSTPKGDLLAGLGTLAEDVLFYATMESLFDLPYIPFTEKILQEYPKLPSHVLEALYHRKDLFDSALLASPSLKENAIPPGCAQTSPHTSPRRRTLTASNVDTLSDSVNSKAHLSRPQAPERTPSLTTSITTSGSDDEVCPVTPPIMADDFGVVGVFSPQSPSTSAEDSSVIPEKTSSVDDATISVPAHRSKVPGVPFHLYYANSERSVMSPMYRTKPKGWSSIFIPPARRVTQRSNDRSINALGAQLTERQRGRETRE